MATTTDIPPQPRLGGTARPKRPSGAPVHLLAAAVFLTVLSLLAIQMRAGGDPKVTAAAVEQPRKRVLVRRIERKVIVTTIQPAAGTAPVAVVAAPSSGAPAPAAAAPAAPAPAPAPVVTRSS
jgi:hypothetical protein